MSNFAGSIRRVRTAALLLYYAAASTAGLTLLSRALRGEQFGDAGDLARMISEPGVLLGVALYASSFTTWLVILTRETVSTAYPIAIAMTYIATIAASATILDEPISAMKSAGIALVAIGAVIIAAETEPRAEGAT